VTSLAADLPGPGGHGGYGPSFTHRDTEMR
jgi:hypothetical protein